MTIGKNMKLHRIFADMSKDDFCEQAGISLHTLERIERDNHEMKWSLICRASEIFGVSVTTLLSRVDEYLLVKDGQVQRIAIEI